MRACWLVRADRKGNLQTKASLVQSLYRRRFLRIVNACINISSHGLGIGMSAKLEVWRGGGAIFTSWRKSEETGRRVPPVDILVGDVPQNRGYFSIFFFTDTILHFRNKVAEIQRKTKCWVWVAMKLIIPSSPNQISWQYPCTFSSFLSIRRYIVRGNG